MAANFTREDHIMDDIVKQIQAWAGLQFQIEEISILSGIPKDELLRDHGDTIERGRLAAAASIRAAVYKSAQNGDQASVKEFIELSERVRKLR